MLKSRRSLLETMMTGAAILPVAPWLTAVVQSPQPMPSPNAPRNQNIPAGMDGPDLIKQQNGPAHRMVNQDQIVASVEQLYKLVSELRDQAQHTNLNETFPLTFVKKAQQIEKLAKQIKEHAKG